MKKKNFQKLVKKKNFEKKVRKKCQHLVKKKFLSNAFAVISNWYKLQTPVEHVLCH